MGYNVQFSRNPELLVCGSILGWKKYLHINTKIWGVGFHYDKEVPHIKNHNMVYAVRGKLTLNKLNLSSNIALGDPGLLLSRFYMPKTKKKYDICIISHYIDYKFFIKNYGDKFFIINMGTNNIEQIANSINKCNFIFSSSLHGIIFSHSLGIPAVHLEYKMLASKKNFKFKDYYSVLDIPYIKEDLKKHNLDIIITKYKKNRYKFLPKTRIIRQIQDNLLFSFPYQKMNNIICTFINNENKYINEWSKYHLNLGFDNIYIYNFNANITENFGDYIDNKIKKRVHIFNINNKNLQKEYFYISFYNLFKHNFKWCAYIDISDYIVLIKWNKISKYLKDPIFKNISLIILKCCIKGDNKKIDRTFKKQIIKLDNIFKTQLKLIVKGGHKRINFKSIKYSNINSQANLNLYYTNVTQIQEFSIFENSFQTHKKGFSYNNNN